MGDLVSLIQRAPVAGTFFILTLLITAYDLLTGLSLRPHFMLNPYLVVQHRQYHRLLTSGFIHADWIHLAFNMFTFYFFAFYLESSFLGPWKFGFVYLFSMVAADLPTVYHYKETPHYNSLGASGAISGVLFSFILFRPNALLGLFGIIPMAAWVFALLFIGFSIFAARQRFDNVNHSAHLWGALAGALLTFALEPIALRRFLFLLGFDPNF